MMKLKVASVVFFVLVAWSATAPAAVVDYFVWQDYGGTWDDANKNTTRTDWSLYCWTGAAADVMPWTGWVPNTLTDAQSCFTYVADHWCDGSGYTTWMWQWYFNGFDPGAGWARPDDPNTYGNFFPQYNVNDFVHTLAQTGDTMAQIEQQLRAGSAVTDLTYGTTRGNGHYNAMWGFRKDTSTGQYVGIWITESDVDKNQPNPPKKLDYYALTQDGGGTYHFTLADQDYTINSVYTLDRAALQWNGGTGAWNSTANWSKAYLPDSRLRAEVDGGTAQLTTSTTVGQVYVGFRGTGVVTHTAGTFTVGELHLGTMYANCDGKYSVGGTGTLTVDKAYIGETGIGRLEVNSGATVNINNVLQFGPNANYSAASGTNLNFNYVSCFKDAAKNPANVAGLAETTFLFNGNGTTSVRTFEVAGQDFGAIVGGFTSNFHIKGLTIGVGNSTYLRLVNDYLNYNGTPPGTYSEALYVHNLILNSGSTLDLNNFHLYCGTFTNYGTVLGGSVIVVQGGAGGLGDNPVIPEPTALLMILPAMLGLAAMLRRRR